MPDTADSRSLAERPLDELIACHECDLLMLKPDLALGQKAICPRCGYELYTHRHAVVSRSLALVLAALLLYFPANFLPIMRLDLRSHNPSKRLELLVESSVLRQFYEFVA